MAAGPTYELIASQTIASSGTTVTVSFTSIPATYTDLRLVWVGTNSASGNQRVLLNSDAGNNYNYIIVVGGTGNYTYPVTGGAFFNPNAGASGGISTTVPHMYSLDLFNYKSSLYKSGWFTGSEDDGASGTSVRQTILWANTAAVTSVSVASYGGTGTWNAGTLFSLYGIAAA